MVVGWKWVGVGLYRVEIDGSQLQMSGSGWEYNLV